jgi:hypothetical protein
MKRAVRQRSGPNTLDMNQDARFTANATLTLQAQREAIASMRAAIAAVLSTDDPLDGRDNAEAFNAAWYLARGAEQCASGATALTLAYGDFAAPSWVARTHAVVLAMAAFAAGTPAELLARHSELLGELDAQLGTLEEEMRDHAMLALGTGNVISDSDLDALLGNEAG